MAALNLGLRFLLELCGIAAAARWGYQLLPDAPMRFVLAALAAATVIGFWAVVVAPKATNPIPATMRFLIGSVVLLVTAALLGAVGQTILAMVFAALNVINTLVLLLVGVRSPAEGWQSGRLHRS